MGPQNSACVYSHNPLVLHTSLFDDLIGTLKKQVLTATVDYTQTKPTLGYGQDNNFSELHIP